MCEYVCACVGIFHNHRHMTYSNEHRRVRRRECVMSSHLYALALPFLTAMSPFLPRQWWNVCVCVCVYGRVCVHMCVGAHMCVCARGCCVCVSLRMCAHARVCVHVCVHVCVCVRACVRW